MSGAHQNLPRRNQYPGKRTQLPWTSPMGKLYPRTSRSPMQTSRNFDLKPSAVHAYLENHPKILDEIILNLSPNKIKYLLRILEKQSNTQESSPKCLNYKPDLQKRHQLSSIKIQSRAFIKQGREPDQGNLLFHTAEMLSTSLQADWFSLYLLRQKKTYLSEYDARGKLTEYCLIGKGMTVSAEAALRRETLIVENLPQDSRYPLGVRHPERDVHSVLSIPVVSPTNDILCVIELCRNRLKKPFGNDDLIVANWMLGWMVCTLHETNINRILDLQLKLNDFLLDVLSNMVDIDELVEHILLFAKELVNAERFAMFLVSEEQNELYADYFYQGISKKQHLFLTEKAVNFSVTKGIAGYVFKTGESVNIFDAYEDERFNSEVDEVTGYHTKNILCMPIVTKSHVVGVIQMVNSLSHDHFTHADENAFKTYAVYCALALHNARMHNELHLCQRLCQLQFDLLNYHIVAPERECEKLKDTVPPESLPANFSQYDFNPYEHEKRLSQLFIYIINDLFGKNAFNFKKMCRFVRTVRKNYRHLTYHNWIHGFQVAHSLYCILKTNRGVFSVREKMALIIAGLCHDLDHRGYNNTYYQKMNLPMAELYGTSVMEQHHYKHTITILQLKDHDIFCFLNSMEYKEMLSMIQEAIIATDLCNYFEAVKEIKPLLENKTLDIEREEPDRKLIKSLVMTAADLCSVAKPWNTQLEMVGRLYREFYLQGDIERTHGIQPHELMDRELRDEIPKQQIGFIRFLCKPLYVMLADILPGTKPLLEGTETNQAMWVKISKKGDDKKSKMETTSRTDQ